MWLHITTSYSPYYVKFYTLKNQSRKILLLIIAVGVFFRLQAQRPAPLITADFQSIPLSDFLDVLERQTGYRFFYDKSTLDATLVSFSASGMPLTDALQKGLQGTSLKYAISPEKWVFISRHTSIQTELPAWLYSDQQHKGMRDTGPGGTYSAIQENGSVQKLLVVGAEQPRTSQNNVTLRGYVRDQKNGEPIVGATVQVDGKNTGSVTDRFGYYTLIVPPDTCLLNVQSIGMEDVNLKLLVLGSGQVNVSMETAVMTLKNVVVSGQKMNNLRSTQLGVQQLDIKTIKQVPVVFGEADIMRVLLTTPGVKTVGEASTGLNVRGGAADQNLILFNESNVYNPAHFFGMFSAFNPEVVKDVELFKGSIPAKYGGRLSSVVNVNGREGNKKKFAGSAGIGLLTSRLQLEGPIVKDKSSFIIGGRTTYADWLLKQLPQEYSNSKASFYDLNAILNHTFNEKNAIHISGYLSQDRFNLNTDTFFHYRNRNFSVKWKHTFNPRFYTLIIGGNDFYEYNISSDRIPLTAYKLSFNIGQTYFRNHYNYVLNNRHTFEFGVNVNLHKLNPGSYLPVGEESAVIPVVMPSEQAAEAALYLSDNFKITGNLSLEAGLRYSGYAYLGPYTVNNYPAGVPLREDNTSGTTTYAKSKIINTYQGPEVRIGLRQMISSTFSVKAGYNSLRQYIHMLSNTAAMAPTDTWKLSDPNIRPQFGDQFSLGLYKNFKSNTIEVSLEGYYKRIKDYLDFKSGAVLLLNPHVETEVLRTKGKAYGAELLIKKSTGKLNGWISYTYSRILLKADDLLNGEVINDGNYYPANYDKPHDLTLISNYKLSHRFSVSWNTTYSTGRPITLPIGRFYYDGGMRTLYADRNTYRIPDYFRMDFSMNIEGNHKVYQKTHSSWTIGVYNVTGRRNPFSVYYVTQDRAINGYKLSVFGSAIPFINYNIRF